MSYFVEGFDTESPNRLLLWMREDHDSFDSWGWAVNWLFDLCGELETRGISAPSECQYRPGAFGPDVSEDHKEGLEEFDSESIYYVARLMNRYCALLDRLGESY